ncbi:MAG TPA: ABC transporter permease, partial [Puia sp.]|nr:ABC transporter permease [Puia sp.]
MLKNYFKTALRSLLKKKTYSFLNIAGLAIGITCASLIFLWTEDEWTFNHNFSKRNLLYRIYENQLYDGKYSTFHATPGPMAQAIKAEIPGIKNVARSGGTGNQLFRLGDKAINEPGDHVDSAMLSMLDLPFVHGTAVGAFRQLHSLVINESMAKKFFGDADPVGRSLNVNNEQDYVITGVFRDLPKNSTFQFHWLAPMENIEHRMPWMQGWGANWARTYVELAPSANPSLVNKQLLRYLDTKYKHNTTECFLFAMNDWNLYDSFTDGKQNGGRIAYVKLFFVIAWIILLIACINFMNLATARSEQRAKEVGMRKVMGAGKGRLIGQFMIEALVMAFIAVILSVLLMTITLPAFNLLVEKELVMAVFAPAHIFYLISIGLITGLIAGSYPAFYLSSFNPIGVLKGIRLKVSTGTGFIRQGLVVVQFSVSIILIIGTVIIYQQLRHVRGR